MSKTFFSWPHALAVAFLVVFYGPQVLRGIKRRISPLTVMRDVKGGIIESAMIRGTDDRLTKPPVETDRNDARWRDSANGFGSALASLVVWTTALFAGLAASFKLSRRETHALA